MNDLIELTVFGVPGRLTDLKPKQGAEQSDRWHRQRWVSDYRPVDEDYWGKRAKMCVFVRFDDELGNGHNTFAITAEVRRPNRRDVEACGCLHDEIAQYFPELEHLIKWHLTSTDGPSHYISNTVYHASNRDHNGLAKGEPCRFREVVRFDDVSALHPLKDSFAKWLKEQDLAGLATIELPHPKGEFTSKYSFEGYGEVWHEGPFDTLDEAEGFLKSLQTCKVEFLTVPTAWSEGKERRLDYARSTAVWPEATDEQLCLPAEELAKLLEARLPALVERFRAGVEAVGFHWSAKDYQA